MQYDPQNVFARILRGEIPCHKVHEDAETLAFMDVMPQAQGHVLVVPKQPSRNLLDAELHVLGPVVAATQKMALAVKKAFSADGVMIVQYNEPAAGQTVFHLHFHIIPRHAGVALKGHTGDMEKPEILAENAAIIRAVLAQA